MLESLFDKVTGLMACNSIKKRLQDRCFSLNVAKFCKIFKNSFFIEYLWLLLLNRVSFLSFFDNETFSIKILVYNNDAMLKCVNYSVKVVGIATAA